MARKKQFLAETHPRGDVIKMPSSTSLATALLRLIAFLGTGAFILWQVVSLARLQPRQSDGFKVLFVVMLAVGFTLLILLPDALRRLSRHPDLLVPLGLFISANALFNTLMALPAVAAILAHSWPVKLLMFSFSLSVSLVFTTFLTVAYVGWTTALIFQVVVVGQSNLITPLSIIRRWFWRVLGLELIGWGTLLSVSVIVLAVAATSMSFALLLLAITSLLWNLATAALVPVALADTQSFWQALRNGMAVSRAGMRKWAPLVVVQMILLGWVTFINVSYTTYETKYTNTTHTSSRLETETVSTTTGYSDTRTEHTKKNWQVNNFWTGGYADDCKWHESLMKALEAEPLPLVNSLLSLLLALLAIIIKLKIVSDIYRPISTHDVTPIV